MSRNDNIMMSHTRSKWWTRLWPESEDTGALLIDFFTVWAPGLECRSSVLGADAPLRALTAENHMRVLVPSRPWTRLDYSQPHIGSDNGLSPGQRQAIIWTNAGILLIEPLGTNFSEILIKIHTFSFKKMHLKMSSAKWHLFGLGLNEFNLLLYISSCAQREPTNAALRLSLFEVSINVELSQIEVISQSLLDSEPGQVDLPLTAFCL